MITVGVWVRTRSTSRPGRPQSWPLGRAAAYAAERGVRVIIGAPDGTGTFAGFVPVGDDWRLVERVPVAAVYDRFPSVSAAEAASSGRAWLRGVPIANSEALISLCRDKLATQRALEAAGIAMPPVEADRARWGERLAEWGLGFLKPQFGSFGEGVSRVSARDGLPGAGAWVLQRAVDPPAGWAGVSVRVLVQRSRAGDWLARSPVVRRSTDDPVVNAARGAELVPGADVGIDGAARDLAQRCAVALDADTGGDGVELGVDLVLGSDDALWPIEVNGRPRGRLWGLAELHPERFASEHVEACAQPLLTLASRVG